MAAVVLVAECCNPSNAEQRQQEQGLATFDLQDLQLPGMSQKEKQSYVDKMSNLGTRFGTSNVTRSFL
jgi:hypothetical protein